MFYFDIFHFDFSLIILLSFLIIFITLHYYNINLLNEF